MDPELIEKFIEVTGENETVARQYLGLADGNVEVAISLMFEGGRPPEVERVDPEPEVRPPILPVQEILVPPDAVYSFPRLSNDVFDRFRDFAVETQRQEEEMTRRVTGVKQISQRMSKRLEDLFRPPCNILFLGSFIEAREHAKTLNRWLLVNIQNPQEFACQVLNRDVWSNQQIQEIVKDHFVLWQVLTNTNDGKHYIDFYNVVEYPYLAIIDPRTGECMQTYSHITVDVLMSALNDMLSTHPSPESAPHYISNSKERDRCIATSLAGNAILTSTNDCSSSSSGSSKTSKHLIDSASDPDSNNVTSNVGSSNTPTSSFKIMNKKRRMEESSVKEQYQEISSKSEQSRETQLKTNQAKTSKELGNESSVRLCLRLPNGIKETISMCATETIEGFVSKMEDMGYSPSEHTYLVPFPKTNIGALPPETQLSDTILSPANTVFITKI